MTCMIVLSVDPPGASDERTGDGGSENVRVAGAPETVNDFTYLNSR